MSDDTSPALDLRHGLTQQRCRALGDLVAQATGQNDAATDLPWLAPVLLFAEPAVQNRLTMPKADPGTVLVHDYQAIRYTGHFPLDTALRARIGPIPHKGPVEYRFSLADGNDRMLAEMDTALRLVPAADLGNAKPALVRTEALKDAIYSDDFQLSQALVDAYLALSGDRNPIHFDTNAAAAMGLDAPVVPGLLLVALIQPFCKKVAPKGALSELKTRFLAPLCVGARVRVCVHRRGADDKGKTTRLRAYLLSDGNKAVAIADLVFAERQDG